MVEETTEKNNNLKEFVVLRSGGLCNRIKSYVSYLIRYDKVYTEKPTDSFIFTNLPLATNLEINTLPKTNSNWRLLVDESEEHLIEKYKTIDLLYEKTPQYFLDKYKKGFKRLVINKSILEKVELITKEWKKESMVGVHLRSWSIDNNCRTHWIDFEGFEREIDKIPKEEKFFFTTDNDYYLNYYREKYKDRIITNKKNINYTFHDSYSDNMELTLDAFTELYLLSQCKKKIIGTFGSTFTEVAWWFGECNAEVVLPVYLEKVEKHFLDDAFRLK